MSGVVSQSQTQQALLSAAEAKALRVKACAAAKEELETNARRAVPIRLKALLDEIEIEAKKGLPSMETAWLSLDYANTFVMECVAAELKKLGYDVSEYKADDGDVQYVISWA